MAEYTIFYSDYIIFHSATAMRESQTLLLQKLVIRGLFIGIYIPPPYGQTLQSATAVKST